VNQKSALICVLFCGNLRELFYLYIFNKPIKALIAKTRYNINTNIKKRENLQNPFRGGNLSAGHRQLLPVSLFYRVM